MYRLVRSLILSIRTNITILSNQEPHILNITITWPLCVWVRREGCLSYYHCMIPHSSKLLKNFSPLIVNQMKRFQSGPFNDEWSNVLRGYTLSAISTRGWWINLNSYLLAVCNGSPSLKLTIIACKPVQ